MSSIGWDKFRILVTNSCNYRCPFCHNEGQDKEYHTEQMSFNDFCHFIDIIADEHISEVNFSGGEPFLNRSIVKMIEYACKHLSCDVSCATNLSLVSEEQLDRLAKTRVKLNIQFPYTQAIRFRESTGNGKLQYILEQIGKARKRGINIGLNTVIQSHDVASISQMIAFALEEELPLKLLPQIGGKDSDKYHEWVFPILQQFATRVVNKGSGATKWWLEDQGNSTRVLYINAPCFKQDIETCRKFGELRILPGLYAQTCVGKEDRTKLNLHTEKSQVLNQLKALWNDFTHC